MLRFAEDTVGAWCHVCTSSTSHQLSSGHCGTCRLQQLQCWKQCHHKSAYMSGCCGDSIHHMRGRASMNWRWSATSSMLLGFIRSRLSTSPNLAATAATMRRGTQDRASFSDLIKRCFLLMTRSRTYRHCRLQHSEHSGVSLVES